jgi:hypothetical protein
MGQSEIRVLRKYVFVVDQFAVLEPHILMIAVGLVLFYNMFICLKLRSPQMVDFHPNELIMRSEIDEFTT